MSSLLDQVTTYARENPGIIACACVTVLLIAITQVVLTSTSSTRSNPSVLTTDFVAYPLIEKRQITHNSIIFRFSLPNAADKLGLPLGRHLSLRATIDGKEVRRPYTPISSNETLGHFDLLIKVYPQPYGTMSRYLESLSIGDTIDVRGPLGKFSYARNSYRRLFMLCGGTGITPMWQVLSAILADVSDVTRLTLVFANVTEDDILMRQQLDQLSCDEERFDVHYVLNNPPKDWTGGVGFVTKPFLQQHFGDPQPDSLVLMCGPPPMNKAMKSILSEMGYTDNQIFKF